MAVPTAGDVTLTYWGCKSSTVTKWTVPSGQTIRSTAYGTGGGRITSILTDAGAQTRWSDRRFHRVTGHLSDGLRGVDARTGVGALSAISGFAQDANANDLPDALTPNTA